MTELTQKPDESLEHFVRRVVRKWQRQGGIKMEEARDAEIQSRCDTSHSRKPDR